jgi:hypothetical protein
MARLRKQEPNFAADGRLALLDLEVLRPALVRVKGVWNDDRQVIAITDNSLSFIDPERPGPLALTGAGEKSVLHYTGSINAALFGLGNQSEGALQIPGSKPATPGRNDPCWCGSDIKFKKCHGR